MASRCLSIVSCFEVIEDPRHEKGRLHELVDILVLAVLAVIAGAEGWEDIEDYGIEKQNWLAKYLRLPHGIPSHDTISRVFRALKPAAFQAAFEHWAQSLAAVLEVKHVAIDGKTLRRSHDRRTMKSALHVVSAWSVENHLLLGQQAVDAKSNEITAIPKLLEMLELTGAVVSIDALGCQKEIAAQIIEAKADYVLAVKDNQPKLHAALQEHFLALHERDFANSKCLRKVTRETGHGRQEQRYYYITPVPKSLAAMVPEWRGIQSVGQAVSITWRDGRETTDVRFYLNSIQPNAQRFADAVRNHWGIENSLHWVLDMTFAEDQSRIRKDYGVDNFAWVRRFATTLIKRDTSRGSVRRKRKRAAWNNDTLLTIVNAAT